MNHPGERLTQALEACQRAGEAILKVYGSDPGTKLKEDRSPLTLADQESHRILASALGGIPFLSEEGAQAPFQERRGWGDFWLVDPLDGTKEFLKGNGEFTVNVALIREGRPVLGVVYAPALEVLYFAAQGLGAFKWGPPAPHSGKGFKDQARPIRAAGPSTGSPLRVAVSRSHPSPEGAAFLQGLGRETTEVPVGSSLKFCWVAEGKADLYPRFGPTMEWDTAAGQAVLEAAGGRVLEAATGQPLRYNKEDLHNPSFAAWGPADI